MSKAELARPRHIPERTCVACGQKLAKREFTRIVRTPQGNVIVDTTGKLPGRGAYLCRSSQCWQSSAKRASLDRSLNVTLTAQDRAQIMAFYQETLAEPSNGEQ
ncbi:MAG: YlxR family protein [Chloroflexi bacterium]|nr:YlxR family protein [Chloroflexota bacterium]